MSPLKENSSSKEFIVLMALLMSLVALSIDAMLPALNQIGQDLLVKNPNDVQFIISVLFLGMAVGLMFYGPISDSYGRKKSIYIGVFIFIVGSAISMLSVNFTMMIVGRFLQGFGAASCRVVATAMIRDRFEGDEMAKVMSLVMMIFILVPALAPSVGQAILVFSDWRLIFGFFIVLATSALLWLKLRQPETLRKENRLDFSLKVIFLGIKETIKNPISRGYMLTAGLIFGAFVGYLSSAQQILQIQYGLGEMFSIVFGALALAIGLSSFVNSMIVQKVGMEKLCLVSLIVMTGSAFLFFFYAQQNSGHPELYYLVGYLLLTFFCMGILFGNLNTLSVQPLGHIAGVASSVISSIQTFLSTILGGSIGFFYDGTILPLVFGFSLFGFLALLMMFYTHKKSLEI